jgi:hypothetical protein
MEAALTPDDRNPFDQETPEYQLFANMIGARNLALAHDRDADAATKKAEAAREKERKFAKALATLTEAGK